MEPLTIKLTLDPETAVQLLKQKPRSLPTATFCAFLIEQSLDKPAEPQIMEEPAARRASSTSTKKKIKELKSIYPNLLQHQELIEGFWRVKKGSKSDQGWKLLMTELTKLQDQYGDKVVEEQLQLAINGLWKGISVRLYEQFKQPKGRTAEPEFKHPAGKVFTAKDFDVPRNASLSDLF